MRNLHKVQAGRGVNAPGVSEIPESVFEELLVNALVHRDYLVSAPIRIFIFDNRIEIISPGHLPNNLTVEKILAGNSNIRNPILVSYIAKGLLPYKGIGSGIRRALDDWQKIDFIDDREGNLFVGIVHREGTKSLVQTSDKTSGKTSDKIISQVCRNSHITISKLAAIIGVTERSIERNIHKLQQHGQLKRIGGRKGGYWQVEKDEGQDND